MDSDILAALIKTVELKDGSTAAHTWRVALYLKAVAERAGLDHGTTDRLVRAASLHDVGKIDIPQHILVKPGPLSEAEYREMQRHTVLGHERLVRMGETDGIVLDLVRSHHERLDGSGYPDGLDGEAIPLAARYFAIIDTFDAMTSRRPYRADVGAEAARRAIAELYRWAGRWYDTTLVDHFGALYDSGELDWILRYFNGPHDLDRLTVLPDRSDLLRLREREGRVDASPPSAV